MKVHGILAFAWLLVLTTFPMVALNRTGLPFHSDCISQSHKGWPGHGTITDLKAAFADPPKGYGNVPFYWWTGDSLDIRRLEAQLDLLSDASTDGLCVSYNHTHAAVDTLLNAEGHGPCGRVSGGSPRVLSDQWRKIWNDFSRKCAERGIGLGMDDYVLAWPDNGEFIDSILCQTSFLSYKGRLDQVILPCGSAPPYDSITSFPVGKDSVAFICTYPAPWLHPGFGQQIVDRYFQPFADTMDEEALKGMNYFFQDELQYGLNLKSWCEDMPQQFLVRKGYDIVPLLKYLFIDNPSEIDSLAAEVRLDYAEVLTQLAEERYFKPIFDWHASKGLIYGCDPEGRGRNPLMYLDYFRAMSWFTAPGNDAPSRGSSFLQTKISSSIAHMYGRPRTWLEAFHSMGWDANGAMLKTQLDHHIIAGGNLLCMHGLYYSTHGGWWEWAPPCFHFRMPYWPLMKLWLKYAERMCFLLSQGVHVCDVAVLYPTETMQAIPGTTPAASFAVSGRLSSNGIDHDFIDYQTLQNSEIRDGTLFHRVSKESYRVLVLADAKALHRRTREKIEEFRKSGGLVIEDTTDIVQNIQNLIDTDFRCQQGRGRVLHRRIGKNDVYMMMDVEKGDSVFFRSVGKVEEWNAMTGSTSEIPMLSSDRHGTWIRYEGQSGNSMLVVFSPGESVIYKGERTEAEPCLQRVTGEWDVTYLPTMDNRWGDFRLPATEGFISVEAREMNGLIYGYGPYMMACNPGDVDPDRFLTEEIEKAQWTPYVWSWQYGVPDSPGSQGWHGLKSRVDSRFLILDRGGLQLFRTNVYAPSDGLYHLISEGVLPYRILIDGKSVSIGEVSLEAGWHCLIIAYDNTVRSEYALEHKRGEFVDSRSRGMVMLYPQNAPEPRERGMYEEIVASKWFRTPFLEFNTDTVRCSRDYRFETAPGTSAMKIKVNGSIERILIDGKAVRFSRKGQCCSVKIPASSVSGIASVCVTGIADRGCPGASFFVEPVYMDCSQGKMPEGDWSQSGALKFYSGAVKYSKDIRVDGRGGSVTLNLGDIDACCEVTVNGKNAGALIGQPYAMDISGFVRKGKNRIEITVYSSLSNHYGTIPSPYRGTPRAGLLGPVILEYR